MLPLTPQCPNDADWFEYQSAGEGSREGSSGDDDEY
jgi:hypothetical protein